MGNPPAVGGVGPTGPPVDPPRKASRCFRIAPGGEDDFVAHWRNRTSQLNGVPGVVSFKLLRGERNGQFPLFASHAVWVSEQAILDWTKSEAFRKACLAAAQLPRDCHLGPPQRETFASERQT